MTKTRWIVIGVGLLTAFAAGRWAAPEKVRIETKIVEVERKTETKDSETNKDKHKTTKTTEVVRPDGTRETTTETTEDTKTDKTKKDIETTDRETDSSTLKEITRASQKTTVSAMYGLSVTGDLPKWGGAVTKPVFGPISVGVFYLTPGVIGGMLGLTF